MTYMYMYTIAAYVSPMYMSQELVKALNENLRLSSSVTELESDMKRQLQQHQRQMEEAQTTIASLHTRQMADR